MAGKAVPARVVVGWVLAASVLALAFAYGAEHVLGARPCILCLYERVPYVAAALVSFGALVLPARVRPAPATVLLICGVIFLTGTGLGVYHVGVEQHWWASITQCSATPLSELTVSDLRATMTGPPPLAACDEVGFRLFGLSLATLNVVFSVILAALCLLSAAGTGKTSAG